MTRERGKKRNKVTRERGKKREQGDKGEREEEGTR